MTSAVGGHIASKKEAPAGFEPAMADLQSAALAAWPRRLVGSAMQRVLGTSRQNDANSRLFVRGWAVAEKFSRTNNLRSPPNLPKDEIGGKTDVVVGFRFQFAPAEHA